MQMAGFTDMEHLALPPHQIPIVEIFQWVLNSGNEAKRMGRKIIRYRGFVKRVFMDSRADDQKLYFKLKKEHRIQLVTTPRKGMGKSQWNLCKDWLRKSLNSNDVECVVVKITVGCLRQWVLRYKWLNGMHTNIKGQHGKLNPRC